jgi:DNA-binding XRE family transcriptional regulator
MKTQDEPVLDDELADLAYNGQIEEQHLPWLNTLAHNVRHFRRLQKVSQQVLADRCGIYRTYLSRIETGKCNPSLTVLVTLSNALDIQPHALLAPLD